VTARRLAAYVWVDKPDGKRGRKWIYGPTREDVHAKWIRLHGRAKTGPVSTKVPTVAEYVAYWLREVVKPNLAPGSYVTYEVLARRYIVPGLGMRKLDRLKVSDVQTWLNGVRLACQCCVQGKDAGRPPAQQRCCAVGACCREVASAASVVHLRRVLRTILNQAIVDEYVTRNVAVHVKLPSVRKRRGHAWSSEEARRFLESARRDRDPMYAAYVLVLCLVFGRARYSASRGKTSISMPRRSRSDGSFSASAPNSCGWIRRRPPRTRRSRCRICA
jgi:Phage integrase, N-terminal SAM-like domain